MTERAHSRDLQFALQRVDAIGRVHRRLVQTLRQLRQGSKQDILSIRQGKSGIARRTRMYCLSSCRAWKISRSLTASALSSSLTCTSDVLHSNQPPSVWFRAKQSRSALTC